VSPQRPIIRQLDKLQRQLDREASARAEASAERKRERDRAREATRAPRQRVDTRSRVHGGPGRPGKKGGQGGKSRPPIGRLEPFTAGAGDQVVVLIHHAEPGELQALASDGRRLDASKPAGVARWWQQAKSEGWAVYSLVHHDRVLAADRWRAGWELHRNNGRTSRLVSPEGATCWPLGRFFRASVSPTAETAEQALAFWRAIDVPPRSLVSMARNYLRSSLTEPVTLFGAPWGDRAIHRELAYPARSGGWAGTWRGMAYDDISAAYPMALGAPEGFPAYLALSDAPGADPIAAEATLRVPERPWAPLPVWQGSGRAAGERAVCYGWGELSGWWSWRELRMALDAGAELVELRRFLRSDGPRVRFDRWLDRALELRGSLPAPAAALAKACTSMTWAVFGLTDRRARVTTWQGAKTKRAVAESSAELPGLALAYVANETHARVRERLWREGLQPGGAVYADTDGVIRPADVSCETGWARRYSMPVVTVAAPQWYRWLDANDGGRRWCVSGIPDGADVDQLDQVWDQAQPEPGTPLAGSLPWSGEVMAPTALDGWGETQRPGDWRGECYGCGVELAPGTAYPLGDRTYCVQCLQVASAPLR
jgi:hypothetical protein